MSAFVNSITEETIPNNISYQVSNDGNNDTILHALNSSVYSKKKQAAI